MKTLASRIAFLGGLALIGGAGCDDGEGTGGAGSTSTATGSTSATMTTSSSTGGGSMDPITTPEGEWTFVDFPDSRCMNDETTGIGVNLSSKSKDLVIFLQGGNACFNTVSCAITANEKTGYQQAEFDKEKGVLGAAPLFSRTDANNPLKDYNYVYVPYCTGDVHGGDAAGVMAGGKVRNFHGYKNLDTFLDRIVPTIPQAGKVILAGVSAGGFGAAYNYDHVAKRFPNNKVILIDDSGPPMAEAYVPACLQKHLFDLWGLKNTVPSGCADCNQPSGVFMEPFVKYIATQYSDRFLTLLSGTEDATIASFWGFGNDDCKDLQGTPGTYPGAQYAAGLADLRDRIAAPDANFYTYYVDGTDGGDKKRHVWLDDPTGVSSNGVLLTDWLKKVITEDPTLVSVPPKIAP
jgi:hypothetical protein